MSLGNGTLIRQDQIAKDAEGLLRTVWNEGSAEVPLPVDPVRIARSMGVEVFDAHLEAAVSGAIVKERGEDPVILLNASDSRNRKRFSCAHEIGHYVRRTQTGASEGYEFVDLRGPLSAQGTEGEEIYANRFAASLLMPEQLVRSLRRDGLPLVELAFRFRVSEDAMRFRLEHLGLL